MSQRSKYIKAWTKPEFTLPEPQKGDPGAGRKWCPVAGCTKSIPEAWTFCKDRFCQGRRHLSPDSIAEQNRKKDEADRRARKQRRFYFNEWRRGYRLKNRAKLIKLRETAVINNHRIRTQRLEQALREADEELRFLIRDQQSDDRKRIVGSQISLDRPLFDDARRSLADIIDDRATVGYLLEWQDPTGDTAAEWCDLEEDGLLPWEFDFDNKEQ